MKLAGNGHIGLTITSSQMFIFGFFLCFKKKTPLKRTACTSQCGTERLLVDSGLWV